MSHVISALKILFALALSPIFIVWGAYRNRHVAEGRFSRMVLSFIPMIGMGYGAMLFTLYTGAPYSLAIAAGFHLGVGLLFLWYFKSYGVRFI